MNLVRQIESVALFAADTNAACDVQARHTDDLHDRAQEKF